MQPGNSIVEFISEKKKTILAFSLKMTSAGKAKHSPF